MHNHSDHRNGVLGRSNRPVERLPNHKMRMSRTAADNHSNRMIPESQTVYKSRMPENDPLNRGDFLIGPNGGNTQ